MKTSNGFEQCYNTQIAVEGHYQLIVATDVTQETNDKKQLIPMVEAVENECGELPGSVLADSGYRSEEAFVELEEKRVRGYEALGREQKQAPNLAPHSVATKRMARRLAGKRGEKRYQRRKTLVEPVFGWVKNVLGYELFP